MQTSALETGLKAITLLRAWKLHCSLLYHLFNQFLLHWLVTEFFLYSALALMQTGSSLLSMICTQVFSHLDKTSMNVVNFPRGWQCCTNIKS